MAEPTVIDASLPEHPDVTRERLRVAGVWDEASKIKRTALNRMLIRLRTKKNARLTRSQRVEAHKASWNAVYERFPVPDDAVPLESLADYLDARDNSEHMTGVKNRLEKLTREQSQRFDEIGESDDHTGEILWVYNNLEKPNVNPFTCPSRGAWTLLAEARMNKLWFYDKMYRPVAQQLSKQQAAAEDGEYKQSKAEKLACAELEEMIKEAVEASAA